MSITIKPEALPFEEAFSPFSPTIPKDTFSGLSPRAEVMAKLMRDLPLNELGLPDYLYRTDLVPPTLFDDDLSDGDRLSILDAATYQMDYSEGYPCQLDGTPLWSQMSFEPTASYAVFLKYVGVVRAEDSDGILSSPIRTLSSIAALTGIKEGRLRELSYLYYWPLRAKAHDLFMLANFQKQRERRALFIEDDHYRKATRWIKKAEARLEEIFADEDLLYDMKPKEVFNMLKELMVIQRVSTGLPANGPAEGAAPQNANLETLLRSLAKSSGEVAKVADTQASMMDAFLDDPEKLAALQQMIIEAGSGDTKPKRHQGMISPVEDAVEVEDGGNT